MSEVKLIDEEVEEVPSNEELINEYLSSKKLGKGNTRKNYRIDIEQLAEELLKINKMLLDAEVKDINNYFNSTIDNMSCNSKNRKLASIRGFYHYYIYTDKYNKKNPTGLLKSFGKNDQKEVRALTPDEQKKLIKCIKNNIKSSNAPLQKYLAIRDLSFIDLIIKTGLRFGEAVTLDFKEFDIEKGSIILANKNTKGEKTRKLEVPADTIKYIDDYVEIKENLAKNVKTEYIFISKNGNILDEPSVNSMIEKYCKLSGITDNITVHNLRHTFASNHYHKYGDILRLQRLLGHSDISTTTIYVDLFDAK